MNALIQITARPIGEETIQTVNARDLHAFLEVRSNFRDWIKNRIADFGFMENQDFTTTLKIYRGGESRDYHVSLDMAKELAMVDRNERGKQARQYFIECEKRAKAAPDPISILNDPAGMRGLLLTYTERVIALEGRLEAAKPKTDFYDSFVSADGLYGLQNAARVLGQPPQKFIGALKQEYLFYQGGALVPKVEYRKRGLFEVKATEVDGKARYQTYVTPKGIQFFAQKLQQNAAMRL